MQHPFQDKLVVFIGTPARVTRQAARDALTDVGGVVDDHLTMFTHYVVAFIGAEKTKVYQKARERERYGHVVLLDETQFFNILEGRAEPPPRKTYKSGKGISITPALDPDADERDFERVREQFIERKRLACMARHGVLTPDGGRAKIDLRPLDMVRRFAEYMKNEAELSGKMCLPDICDKCGIATKVHMINDDSNEVASLCLDCYNRIMADETGIDMYDIIPNQLSFKGKGGKTHTFDIELRILPNGQWLTATELGKTRRRVIVRGSLNDDFDSLFEKLKKSVKNALSVTYMRPDGTITKNTAVGYIQYSLERERHEIIIDGKPYTWAELEKNIAAREGWGIKIEFGDVGDDYFDADREKR